MIVTTEMASLVKILISRQSDIAFRAIFYFHFSLNFAIRNKTFLHIETSKSNNHYNLSIFQVEIFIIHIVLKLMAKQQK